MAQLEQRPGAAAVGLAGAGRASVGLAERAGVPSPRGSAPRQGKPARLVPERDDTYAHLELEALRGYRTALQAEETKVSYWRRIIQARLDVVRSGGGGAAAQLAPVLREQRVTAGRTALVEVLPVDDIPPLPNLGELWERRVSRDDEQGLARLDADLQVAEEQLSAYRTALHRRLAGATGELIARYREQPTLCLVALPLPRTDR